MKKPQKSKKILLKKKLPKRWRPFFWSYRFNDLNQKEDDIIIIKQLIAYGDIDEWKWLVQTYGTSRIKQVLSKVPRTELRPSLVNLLKNTFSLTHMPYARRVPHTRS